MPYDVERDLVPITGVSDAPIVLTANSSSPFKSVADVKRVMGTRFTSGVNRRGVPTPIGELNY
jgi:hypothetical protein